MAANFSARKHALARSSTDVHQKFAQCAASVVQQPRAKAPFFVARPFWEPFRGWRVTDGLMWG